MSQIPAPKILVIEDETTQRILVKEYLEESGFVVRLADDGRRGLEMASAINPDLIILDLLLPSMDGYTLCTRLKQDPATAQIPVILVTAAREADVIERGMAAGASDFVTKPVDWSYLSDRVSHVLQQSRDMKQLAAEKQASEQKLQAVLESKDLSPEQINEIKQLSVEPTPTASGMSLAEFERQMVAVRVEAEERVRKAESVAAAQLDAERKQAAHHLEHVTKSFWSLISQTSQAHLPMLTALEQLTSGTAADENVMHDDISLMKFDAPQNPVQSLLATTRNMEALARDMSGAATLSEEQIDLVAFVEDVVETLRPVAEQRQVEIRAALPDAPLEVIFDPRKIRSAVLSLAANALKYSPQNASIEVSLTTTPGKPIQVSLKDNGIGMAPAVVENLRTCDMFPMNAVGARAGGFGFGVPMAMSAMIAHDGHLTIESEVGKGTTMTLCFPEHRKCNALASPARETLTDKSTARREDVPIARLNALLAS